jgi:periplasmic divalent cation tolerance protein
MSDKYIMILTTTDNETEAEKISEILVQKKYAACAQMSKIKSFYTWQGKFEKSEEFILYIKTKASLFDKVKDIILQNHSYDLPEIISLPITDGYSKYFDWMNENILTL